MRWKSIYWAVFLGCLLKCVNAEIRLYECPFGWEEFGDNCYRFVKDPLVTVQGAREACQVDGAYRLSITTNAEHVFVVNHLNIIDNSIIKHDWWTSGRRLTDESAEFYWEGDGTKIESFFYWHNDSIPQQTGKNWIIYHYDGYKWGWILGTGNEFIPYICEISKEDVYKITQDRRGPDYGVDNPDQETIERGPKFVEQPQDTVFESSNTQTWVPLNCLADSYPNCAYAWTRERAGNVVPIDPSANPRYSLVNGRLIIHNPSTDQQDDGRYQCKAENPYGSILSNVIQLGFGYLQDFPKSPRAPVTAISYQWASIECSPPAHYPEILYTWYKNDIYNFIRPELKPYIMISHDGRLYFSEVTSDDIGNYYCLVYKPGQALAEGRVSMPTPLHVTEGSPGIYEPKIGSGFPLVYPNAPKVGDTLRIECWASGTSRTSQLEYTWDKVELDSSDKVIRTLPLPNHARLIDHNRVLTIPNVGIYDAGTYRCSVRRLHGQSDSATVPIILQAMPYFTLELQDQFADVGSMLTWRCEAGGDPAPVYFWLKNALPLDNSTISPEDRDRLQISNNVLRITALDAKKDDGMYQCAARNTHGVRYSTAELRVLSFPPNFKKYPLQPNQFATIRGNTTLLCRPEAAPYPIIDDIIWFKNGGVLNPGTDDTARVRKMPNGNLFFKDLQASDGGVYKCQVSNSFGQADTTGNLTVLSTTSISYAPRDTNIQVNRTNVLQCMASYDPQMDVTYVWYMGDMLVEFERIDRLGENRFEVWYNPHFKRGTGIYNGALYIMNAQYHHKGSYSCNVLSTAGSMSASANVFIYGPPSEPAGVFHSSSTVTTSSVVIQWKTHTVAGTNGRPILGYVVESYNGWEAFWRIHMTNVQVTPDPSNTMRLNVTGLRPDSMYLIRMRAENEIGTSEASLPTDQFTTFPVKPDRYPDQVGGGGGKVGDLTITWKPLPEWEHNGRGIGYRVRFKNAGDEEWDEVIELTGNVARYVHLVGETNFYREYEVCIQAFNDEGDGPISPIVTIRSAMGLPTVIAQNVRSQPWNATACLVHWEPVQDTRDHIKGKLGGYRISYWKECCETEDMAPRKTISGQASEGMVIGLMPNTPYYFDVMVWNEAGNGPKSQYFIQRTLRKAPINMPVEVQINRRNSHAIHVSWRGVSTAQTEEPLEGYKVRIWRDGEHIKVATDYDSAKETDLYIDGLRDDILYKLRVFGYSRGGQGAMSSPALKFMTGDSVVVKPCTFSLFIFLLLACITQKLD